MWDGREGWWRREGTIGWQGGLVEKVEMGGYNRMGGRVGGEGRVQ